MGDRLMNKHALVLLLTLVATSYSAIASDSLQNEEHLLDGMSFTFQYQNAGAMDVSFDGGLITYKWIAGRNAEEPKQSYRYKSRKLDSDMYLVNWHEPESKNFVTMVYNFRTNTCAVSVISKYADQKPFMGFQAGVIEHVKIGSEGNT